MTDISSDLLDQLVSPKGLEITCPNQARTLQSPVARQAYATVGVIAGFLGLFGVFLAFRKSLPRLIIRPLQKMFAGSNETTGDIALVEEMPSAMEGADEGSGECERCDSVRL